LSEGGDDAQAAGVGDGGGELGVANPLHASLNNGDADAELAGEGGVERHRGCLSVSRS